MDTYYFSDENNMRELHTEINNIRSLMDSAYHGSRDLYDLIAERQDWTGDAEKTAEAFLDVITQYHKALCDEDSPLAETDDHFEAFETASETFFDDFEDYKTLKEVSYGD